MKDHYPIILLLTALIFHTAQSSNAQHIETNDKIKQIENGLSHYHQIKGEPTWTIADRMEHYGVPGMSIAVIRDYKIAWTKTYGVKNKETNEPITENTLFQAASISKPVSSYAALSLVEAGKLDLDKNINDYLTSWQVPDNEFTKDEKVTLKHLVSHKAGLTVHGFLGYAPDLKVPTLVQVLDGVAPANSSAIRVNKTPGGKMRYSGGGYCVLQQTMIDVTGNTFPIIMQEQVLTPLGMSKSTFEQPLSAEKIQKAATGYLPDGTMVKGERHTYPEMAAAGLWTNAAELAKFVIDLQESLQGKSEKVLSSSMAKKMVTSIEDDFLGLGIFLKHNTFGHGGWNEGFSSDMRGHIKDGYGVIVMINANQPAFINEVMTSVSRVYAWEESAPAPHEPLSFTSDEIQQISGKYELGFDDNMTIYQDGDKVFLKYLSNTSPQELIKIAENTYVRREKSEVIQFLKESENDELSLVFLSTKDTDVLDYNKKTTQDTKKLGIEYLLEGELEKALAIYQNKKKEHPEMREVQENHLNSLGYEYLGKENLEVAIQLFRLNVALYPDSFNTYDSLGEAYALKGNTTLAIKNYEKSVVLNPQNQHGLDMIKKLKAKQ